MLREGWSDLRKERKEEIVEYSFGTLTAAAIAVLVAMAFIDVT